MEENNVAVNNHVPEHSDDIRQQKKAFRNSLTTNMVKEKSSHLTELLSAYINEQRTHIFSAKEERFLCYYPLGNEVDLRPLYQRLLSEKCLLYFPRTARGEITFYKVSDLSQFEEGCFHVMEPLSQECFRQFDTTIDERKSDKVFAFVPGLAFDEQYHRIGYGGGYFDRYFATHPRIIKCGIAYEEQMVDRIQTNPWDVSMDMIASDRRIRYGTVGDM